MERSVGKYFESFQRKIFLSKSKVYTYLIFQFHRLRLKTSEYLAIPFLPTPHLKVQSATPTARPIKTVRSNFSTARNNNILQFPRLCQTSKNSDRCLERSTNSTTQNRQTRLSSRQTTKSETRPTSSGATTISARVPEATTVTTPEIDGEVATITPTVRNPVRRRSTFSSFRRERAKLSGRPKRQAVVKSCEVVKLFFFLNETVANFLAISFKVEKEKLIRSVFKIKGSSRCFLVNWKRHYVLIEEDFRPNCQRAFVW